MTELSIVIPAYNEAKRIEFTLENVIHYLDTMGLSYEMIVVDDGSGDETTSMVRKFKKVKLLLNGKNKGKGYSVRKGMLEATGNLRLFMDADHSVHIRNIQKFIDEVKKGADIVIGSIEIKGATIEDQNHNYRRVFGRWAKQLIRMLAVPGIYDTQRGFKLFTRQAAEILFPQQTVWRWGFDIEILRLAQKEGLRIHEIPVEWHNPSGSKVTLWSYFHTLYELLKIRF